MDGLFPGNGIPTLSSTLAQAGFNPEVIANMLSQQSFLQQAPTTPRQGMNSIPNMHHLYQPNAPLQPLNGLSPLHMMQLLSNIQNFASQFQQPIAHGPSLLQNSVAKIIPSNEIDSSIVARLREAKSHGTPYRIAVEGMTSTHGSNAADWTGYFVDRFEILVDLLKKLESTSSASLALTHGRHEAEDISRAHKRTRKTFQYDDDGSSDDEELTDEPGHKEPAKKKKKKRTSDSRQRVDFQAGEIPIVETAVTTDMSRTYRDTEEIGEAGSLMTSGDLNAMARWIAKHTNFESLTNQQRWEPFSKQPEYSNRSYKAWAEGHRNRRAEIQRRVDEFLANKVSEEAS